MPVIYNMNRIGLTYLFTIAITFLGLSQSAEEAYLKKYEENIQLEYINDVYIPIDLMDAMKQIDDLSNEEGRARLLEANEELAAERLVFGLGKWMIVNWNFYEGSRLSHHIKSYGVTLPDDMARFLIISYHRYLRDAPIELKERGNKIFDLRKQEQEERNKQRVVVQEIIK
ncbi:MAG: hypothetical protein ACI9FN_000383 [Saprospiraceae bacterium]|jgi:hypothetical protein